MRQPPSDRPKPVITRAKLEELRVFQKQAAAIYRQQANNVLAHDMAATGDSVGNAKLTPLELLLARAIDHITRDLDNSYDLED